MTLAGTLTKLFEYQNFEKNKRLQALIDKTEDRYLHELSDDDLEWVSAAGDVTDKKGGKSDE